VVGDVAALAPQLQAQFGELADARLRTPTCG